MLICQHETSEVKNLRFLVDDPAYFGGSCFWLYFIKQYTSSVWCLWNACNDNSVAVKSNKVSMQNALCSLSGVISKLAIVQSVMTKNSKNAIHCKLQKELCLSGLQATKMPTLVTWLKTSTSLSNRSLNSAAMASKLHSWMTSCGMSTLTRWRRPMMNIKRGAPINSRLLFLHDYLLWIDFLPLLSPLDCVNKGSMLATSPFFALISAQRIPHYMTLQGSLWEMKHLEFNLYNLL